MSLWTNGGKLVVDASKKPIECPDCPCGGSACNQECCNGGKWPDTINCDIGDLGWTDGDCSVCDTLGGIYALTVDTLAGSWNPDGNCIWKYDSGVLCTFDVACSSAKTASARLLITATLTTSCNWSVLVEWRHTGLDDSCPGVNKSATYTISDSGDEDCNCVTLSLFSEDSSDDLSCVGSFPATIALSRGDFDCPPIDGFALPAALARISAGVGLPFVASGNVEYSDVYSVLG